MVVHASCRVGWHGTPCEKLRAAVHTAWNLTCEDGAGNVLDRRTVYVDRKHATTLGAICGAAGTPTEPAPVGTTSCGLPNGFSRVDVQRRGRGLRFAFRRTTRNPVTVD